MNTIITVITIASSNARLLLPFRHDGACAAHAPHVARAARRPPAQPQATSRRIAAHTPPHCVLRRGRGRACRVGRPLLSHRLRARLSMSAAGSPRQRLVLDATVSS